MSFGVGAIDLSNTHMCFCHNEALVGQTDMRGAATPSSNCGRREGSGRETQSVPEEWVDPQNHKRVDNSLFHTPSQKYLPVSVVSQEEAAFISGKVQSLLEKGTIEVIMISPLEVFFSTISTVTKKGGERRPIISLKCFNKFVCHNHFER